MSKPQIIQYKLSQNLTLRFKTCTARTSPCQTQLSNRYYPSQLHILPHTSPVTESEIENVINTAKGKSSAGFDEIPEFLVKGKFTLY